MALTDQQAVRLKIQDIPSIADTTYYFDGSANEFALPHRVINSASAFVAGSNGQWSASAATFSEYTVSFADIGSANSAFRTRYIYSTFSDDEIDHFLTVGGDVIGAAVEATHSLMFDSLKRAAWRAADGSQFDDTAAQRAVMELYDKLKMEQREAAVAEGGFQSWAVNQGYQ